MKHCPETLYMLFFNSNISYILQIVPFVLLVGIAFWLIRGLWLKKRNLQRKGFVFESLLLLFTCYCAGLFSLVWVPSNFWPLIWFRLINGYPGGEMYPLFSGSFNFSPSFFGYITGALTGGSWIRFMLIGNTLMFVPFGLLFPAIRKNASPIKTIGCGIALSLLIELGQPIVGRQFDIDDIIANTIGTIIGYLLFLILKGFIGKFCKTKPSLREH